MSLSWIKCRYVEWSSRNLDEDVDVYLDNRYNELEILLSDWLNIIGKAKGKSINLTIGMYCIYSTYSTDESIWRVNLRCIKDSTCIEKCDDYKVQNTEMTITIICRHYIKYVYLQRVWEYIERNYVLLLSRVQPEDIHGEVRKYMNYMYRTLVLSNYLKG